MKAGGAVLLDLGGSWGFPRKSTVRRSRVVWRQLRSHQRLDRPVRFEWFDLRFRRLLWGITATAARPTALELVAIEKLDSAA